VFQSTTDELVVDTPAFTATQDPVKVFFADSIGGYVIEQRMA
jgi:hypothetical protein